MDALRAILVKYLIFFILCPVALYAAIDPVLITSYVNSNRTEIARRLSAVDPKKFLQKKSFAGFLTVDKKFNSNLFYWYFPVPEKKLNETPWIVWLQGGPGATSLAGLFDEIGPFEYDATTKDLKERQYAWTNNYSVVFIDSPIGAGYSFTEDQNGFARTIDTCSSHLIEALRQFLLIFEELRKAPLYIAGESYAGIYIPNLALKIHQQKDSSKILDVNLQGLILGSPVMDRLTAADYIATYYKWGLLDTQGASAVRPLQRKYLKAIKNNEPIAAYELRTQVLETLQELSQHELVFNIMPKDGKEPDIQAFVKFLKRRSIRDAIHTGDLKFSFSNTTARYMLMSEFLQGGGQETAALLENYKVLLYCGNFDLIIPCVEDAGHRRINWKWSKSKEFLDAPRYPVVYNGSITAYSKSGGGFTEVMFIGAGHMVPMDKPAEVYNVVTSFIDGTKLTTHPDFKPKPEHTPDITRDDMEDDFKKYRPTEDTAGDSFFKLLLIYLGLIYYYAVRAPCYIIIEIWIYNHLSIIIFYIALPFLIIEAIFIFLGNTFVMYYIRWELRVNLQAIR